MTAFGKLTIKARFCGDDVAQSAHVVTGILQVGGMNRKKQGVSGAREKYFLLKWKSLQGASLGTESSFIR